MFFLVSIAAHAAVRPERWRWSNPLPHGNNVLDMFVTTDLAAQVGDGGTIYVQRTDERWAPAVSGVTNYLRGVALLGERFIAVGESGCILWSDDGNYFQPAQLSPATSDWFEGVTASAQRAVAVGDNGSIYTSTNGATWSKTTSGTTEWLRGVAFGNGAYVAVGENGKILRSTGGTSWSPVTSGTTAHLNRVRYVGTAASGQFIAVGNSGAAFSSATGNAPWTSLNSGTTNALYDVAANDTRIAYRLVNSAAQVSTNVAFMATVPLAPDTTPSISKSNDANEWTIAWTRSDPLYHGDIYAAHVRFDGLLNDGPFGVTSFGLGFDVLPAASSPQHGTRRSL
ncbi:MAG TPA: hypothetical protein PLV92_24645, partial [Pirellulaceae bacterium]|nr:hypothetical protein [Pirellulaceae bacterium]